MTTHLERIWERQRTSEKIGRHFLWSGMERQFRAYVRSCEKCQPNTPIMQSKGGKTQSKPFPKIPWESVSMNFITQLPTSDNGFDVVMVVADRLTKMTHFMPTTTTLSTMVAAHFYFYSERDPRFFFRFWQALWQFCSTALAMSTSYHPQTDG